MTVAFLAAALISSIGIGRSDITDGLAAHWTFDGNDIAGKQVIDVSPAGQFPGTISGNVQPAAGIIGGALHFGGTAVRADNVDFGNVLNPGSNSFSVSLWFKPDVVAGAPNLDAYLLTKGNQGSSGIGWSLWYKRTGEMIVRAYDGSGSANRASQQKPGSVTTDWHHAVMVIDREAGTIRGYLDGSNDGFVAGGGGGVVDTFKPGTSISIDATLKAGVPHGLTSCEYAGLLDDIGIWQRALTPEEIATIYLNGLGGTNLTGHMPILSLGSLTPADGSLYLPADTAISFNITSKHGVDPEGIRLLLNGIDRSADIQRAGDVYFQTVTLSPLQANTEYEVSIAVTDRQTNQVLRSLHFNTFSQGVRFIEAEDYNFDGGQFIDYPSIPTQMPGPDSYLDRMGVPGIDYWQLNTPGAGQDLYRLGDGVGTSETTDALRQNYLDAQALDPGVSDYEVRLFADGEWLNYTRTFGAATYGVFGRMANSGAAPLLAQVDLVTNGGAAPSQLLSPVGYIRVPAGSPYNLFPLTDIFGNPVALRLDGRQTLRLSALSGCSGLRANYLVLVPSADASPQAPYISAAFPAPDSDDSTPTPTIQVVLRESDTQVVQGSIQLRLDGAEVIPAISTSSGTVTLSCPVAQALALGRHSLALSFSDNATPANVFSNRWEFVVANLATPGFWQFNEKAAGGIADATAGSLMDESGNDRHGTAHGVLPYVAGSPQFGGSTALRFDLSTNTFVSIPDPTGFYDFSSDQSFTVEAVFRPRSLGEGDGGSIIAKQSGSGEWFIRFGTGDLLQFFVKAGAGSARLTGTTPVVYGVWHHVAAVFDAENDQIRLYLDYQMDGLPADVSAVQGLIGNGLDLFIGKFQANSRNFDGDIDAIRISRGALEPGQFIQNVQPFTPEIRSAKPAGGQTALSSQPIQITLLNRDTQVAAGTIGLRLNQADITPGLTIAELTNGLFLEYASPVPYQLGANDLELVFQDNASPAHLITNQWSFQIIPQPQGHTPEVFQDAVLRVTFDFNTIDSTAGSVTAPVYESSIDYTTSLPQMANSSGTAAVFNGIDSVIDYGLGAHNELKIESAFTYHARVRFDADRFYGSSTEQWIMGRWDSDALGTSRVTMMTLFGGPRRIQGSAGSSAINGGWFGAPTITEILPDVFYDVFVRFEPGVALYLDVFDAETGLRAGQPAVAPVAATALLDSTIPFEVGNRVPPHSVPMAGAMEQINVWTRVLTELEMLLIANGPGAHEVPGPRITRLQWIDPGSLELAFESEASDRPHRLEQCDDWGLRNWTPVTGVTYTPPAGGRIVASFPASAGNARFYRVVRE